MKRTLKIGVAISIISITSVIAAGVFLNHNVKPLSVIFTDSAFEGINIDVNTDKEVYAIGEKIQIDVSLTNTNSYDSILYCQGWKDRQNDELYSLFLVTIYDENYTQVWYRTVPDKNELIKFGNSLPSNNDKNKSVIIDMNESSSKTNPERKIASMLGYYSSSFTLNLNASSTTTYSNISSWNQTAKDIRVIIDNVTWYDFNKQVPTGTYIITVTVPLNMNYYFGNVYKEFYFGSSKTIKII